MTVPSKIGKYDVIRVLGRGGMGTVYHCIDPDLQRFVAVKVLNQTGKKADALYPLRMRFLREAFTTAQLQHPAIPPVYDVGKDETGHVFYVMKPIEGIPLSDIIDSLKEDSEEARDKYDIFRLVQILSGVCQAIQYAHNKGFIHRDLKPSNIFVGNYGDVYVIDWGLTKVLKDYAGQDKFSKLKQLKEKFDIGPEIKIPAPDLTHTIAIDDVAKTKDYNSGDLSKTVIIEDSLPTREISADEMSRSKTLLLDDTVKTLLPRIEYNRKNTLTASGKILGTLSYMAPEQAVGANELGKETDIYALGVILYELLTFELPVSGDSLKEVVGQKLDGSILLPEVKSPGRNIPPELSAIAMQAMDPDPGKRFKSAKELNDALEFWFEGKSLFRPAVNNEIDRKDFIMIPKGSDAYWGIDENTIFAVSPGEDVGGDAADRYLIFKNEFIGDIYYSMSFITYPHEESRDTISEFAIMLNTSIPKPWKGFLDGYSIHFGAGGNTRAALCRHGVEIFSNEYLTIEPRKKYHLEVELTGQLIKVSLNRQIILFFKDSSPCTGTQLGFMHLGPGLMFSDIKVRTRGLPGKVSALDVPEALMAEGCYEAAGKSFMSIAQGHRNRFLGAWALYKAGMASYLLDHDFAKAAAFWKALRKGPFAPFEKLGEASIELENGHHLNAIKIINGIILGAKTASNLEPIADTVFEQAQQSLRNKPHSEEEWKVIDGWARLALRFGERFPNRQTMTPSILWRWMLLALIEYPNHLSDCIMFLRKVFGEGKGSFAEIVTTIEPLMIILRRSTRMSDHAFLVGKVMRLLLNYDDNLGNLETLVRFYLNSGHVKMAEKISKHIYELCEKHECEVPPFPITLLACKAWISNSPEAKHLIETMISRSSDWGVTDGKLLLGLDSYRNGKKEEAFKCWEEITNDKEAISFNRHLAAKGLLGRLSPDPVKAGVPNRSDHRLLYCLFVGYRHFLDWESSGSKESFDTAAQLFKTALKIMRPSYDIYSANDIFLRIPMQKMKIAPPPKAIEPLSKEEIDWIESLTKAALDSKPEEFHRTTSSIRISTSTRENQKLSTFSPPPPSEEKN
ncbi:MAG: hypothetical protein A2020_08085 [Lentisphaerae bacterium GWF2_45_14]|nr:MAG: hypothetical protein A2020_08085 [Lentisphaerae bacterium GWF2_45_14]